MRFHFGPCIDQKLETQHSQLREQWQIRTEENHDLHCALDQAHKNVNNQAEQIDKLSKENKRLQNLVKVQGADNIKKQNKINHLEGIIKETKTNPLIIDIKHP